MALNMFCSDCPEISLIIPVYNVERYLSNCLNSVLSQTFADFEVICVNDGSTDSSGDILKNYQSKDKRVFVLSQNNQGLSVARNNGIELSKGKYVYFLDSDDVLHPQALECLHYLITTYQADIAVGGVSSVKDSPENMKLYDYKKEKVFITKRPLNFINGKKDQNIPINVFKLYKRELVVCQQFIPKIYFEDFPFTICLLKNNPKTVLSSLILYFHIENNQSITHSNWTVKKMTDYCQGMNKIIEFYQDSPIQLISVTRYIFPKFIKQAFNNISRHLERKEDLEKVLCVYKEFFIQLNKKHLFSWRGHKLTRYLFYRRLMKTQKVSRIIPLMRKIFK